MKIAALLPFLLAATAAWPQAAKDVPLITNANVTVTAEDFEAFLLQAPAKLRPEIRASYERIGKAVDIVYSNRVLAEEAKRDGLDKDPRVQLRLNQLSEAFLAQAWIEQFRSKAVVPDVTARVEELYRLNKDKYRDPERISSTYLLISLKGRTRDAALARATEVHRKAMAGEDFDTLVKEYSEDSRVVRNQGRVRSFPVADMERLVADALLALKKPGDITAPVETRGGYQVVRLDKRTPARQRTFAEVKEGLVEQERSRLIGEAGDRRIGELKNNARTKVYEANINALKVDMTPVELERATLESMTQNPPPR